MSGNERIGVGIVGLGSIGVTHARALAELREHVDLVAYSGGGPQQAAQAGWPDVPQVPAARVALADGVDVVAVCTPTETHPSLTVAALEAGRHVVVEKPLALSVADAERIAALAGERGRTVTVISQRRFEPAYAHVADLARQGLLGELRLATTHVHWHRDADYYRSAPWRGSMTGGGGSLMNQGVHNVDLLQWIGGPVESVTAQYATVAQEIDAEDTTVATVRFASGALGVLSTSTATPPGEPATMTLYFSRGVIALGQGTVTRWEVDGVAHPPQTEPLIRSGASSPSAIGHLGHLTQWQDVVAALRDGREPAIGIDEGVATVRLLCAIYDAARTGRVVRPAALS